VLHAADTRGAGFFSNPLLRNNRLHRHFGDVVLHGRSLGIHDRNPELDCLVSICLRLGDIERQCATDVGVKRFGFKCQPRGGGRVDNGIDRGSDDYLVCPALD